MGLGALQPMHLIVVLVIVLLVFGPGKLPELGKAVGDGLRELKKAWHDRRRRTIVCPTSSSSNCYIVSLIWRRTDSRGPL